MSVEFWTLFGAMVLGLVHLTAASFTFKAQVGNAYSVGARDEDIRPAGVAGRLDRAQRNYLETFAIFAAAVLMLESLDRTGSWLSVVGALIYLGGRTLFLPLYAAGVPWLRTFSWNIATAGLAMVMVALVWLPEG
ncbi:MAG: MAPEG family protein [Hyphomonadaceae bacterium]|nr:MAPEG family protein [Hyphomonadaceae bacterium]